MKLFHRFDQNKLVRALVLIYVHRCAFQLILLSKLKSLLSLNYVILKRT